MKFFLTLSTVGLLFLVLIFSGCTGSSQPLPAQTPVPATTIATIPSMTPTPVPYPNAVGLNQEVSFGSANGQGSATVYRYEIRSNYNWTAPSWNSPAEQVAASQPLELQNGYNMEKPKEGNTFLFLFVRVENIGTKTMIAPSAQQFVVYSGGKMYNYTSVHSSDVVIDHVPGTQYDYKFGQSGSVGSLQPGESNRADGYLIYEVPASFSPGATWVVCNLDKNTQASWKLS
jgi:hypothetical protein